jgi:hypothetical protein
MYNFRSPSTDTHARSQTDERTRHEGRKESGDGGDDVWTAVVADIGDVDGGAAVESADVPAGVVDVGGAGLLVEVAVAVVEAGATVGSAAAALPVQEGPCGVWAGPACVRVFASSEWLVCGGWLGAYVK